MADHKAGVILLALALLIQTGFNQSALAKVLVSDLGGPKRVRALSMCMSALILSPWAIFNLFSSALKSTEGIEILPDPESMPAHTWLYFLIPVLVLSLFVFVVDFYVDAYVAQKTDQVFAAKVGTIFVFTCSVGLSFIWNHPHVVRIVVMDKIKAIIEQEHALSWGVLISYTLYCLGSLFLACFVIRNGSDICAWENPGIQGSGSGQLYSGTVL